ncbi:hypothetical protein IWX90DRAFT_442785 [Phyllosticta citrichinensis]|uniref:FAD-binding PCMH-type domain-containing protein n=1 Tax=Phyllosticta citrichinensis TaxID=1130410 RepID=A0ABR1XI69_9PEZI
MFFQSLACGALFAAAAAAAPASPSSGSSSSSLASCVSQVFAASDPSQRIVTPENSTYTDARLGEKIQFEEFPAIIAYAKDVAEVAPLVNCAVAHGVPPVARSGGHHFLAYSSLNGSLVIDLSHVNHVSVSADKQTAVVGGGIRLGALYMALDAHDVTFVGGICPTVGLGGLLSAGGFNMQMRALGLTADYIVAAKVVLANGTTVEASPSSNADLFWAIRGGGGNTYGIVVEATLKLDTFPRFAAMSLEWGGGDAQTRFDIAKRFLEWGPALPKEVTSQINVYKDTISIIGVGVGISKDELQALVDDSGLGALGNATIGVFGGCSTDNMRTFGYTSFACEADDKVDKKILNVVQDPFSQFDSNPQFSYDEATKSSAVAQADPWSRFRRMSKSFFVLDSQPLPDDVLARVLELIASADDASQIWGEWHAWNLTGAPAGDSAFPWRDSAVAHLEFQMHGSNDTAQQQSYETLFAELESVLRPAIGPASYSGYMDASISVDHLEAYYGDNIERLVGIKQAYDPTNVFHNPYSILAELPANVSSY